MKRLKTTRKVKSLEKLKQNIPAPKEYNNFFKETPNSSETNIYFNVEKLEKEIEVSYLKLNCQIIFGSTGIKNL